MVQMLFYIRFRGQLRRTNPDLIVSLEDTVAASASAAGGVVETGRKALAASFNEDRIGFWLDIAIFLDKVHRALERTMSELYGYALVLGQDIFEASGQKLCRSLSGKNGRKGTGIWCLKEIRKALAFYMSFETHARSDGISGDYRELLEFRSFGGSPNGYPRREKIERVLALGRDKNTLLLGPEHVGKRDGIFHYCAGFLGDIPPLVVRFGAGGRGLVCFADAYTPVIRSFIADAVPRERSEELNAIHTLLFGERLREEWSPYMMERGRSFIRLLLSAYIAVVTAHKASGVLIIEDLSLADSGAADVFREVFSSLDDRKSDDRKRLLILAADNSTGDGPKGWGGIFPRILRFSPDDFFPQEKNDPGLPIPWRISDEFPRELWELAYLISLLGQYFPSYLFPRLFEAEGLSSDMYFRSMELLAAMGVFIRDDTRPRLKDFNSRAEKALGNRKDKVRGAVRNQILAWALSGRLRPCFNLLRILSELGERAGDALTLKSLKADILNGTWEGIEEALNKGYFASLVGAGNAPALNYIYKTFRALVRGERDEIQQVFLEPVPPLTLGDGRPCYGGCRVQVEVNLAAYHIGGRNIEAASEAMRKAMVLNRELGGDAIPAYRLFSLVNLSKQRIDDALEYVSFAQEQAERGEKSEELFLSYYFASSINFLFGNLSKAERFAKTAEDTALELGQINWNARAKFLRGRLCFEIGRYNDALDIFESLRPAAISSAMDNTVGAWIYRTGVFLGRFPSAGASVLAGLDAKIFEIEAAYYAADYERAVALAGRFLTSPTDTETDFFFTEQPDWRSGFSQCEYMLKPEKVPGTRLAWVYRAMAQCALRASRAEKEEILGGMQRFIRDELLPDTDPYDAFYFHGWYCMLRDSGASQVDMNTVVSMALKRIQRRTGRIDEREARQAFLDLPRWNSTLYLAAREYKLI